MSTSKPYEQIGEAEKSGSDLLLPGHVAEKTTKIQPIAEIEAGYTELGNARRLVSLCDDGIRYCPQHKIWYFWDGVRWVRDETGQIDRYAKNTIKSMYHQASKSRSRDTREKLGKWAVTTESSAQIRNMIELAKTEPNIPINASHLDKDPLLLGVENGVVDLRTGILQPSRRENYITKTAAVRFDSSAKCPKWMNFLRRICDEDSELVRFHQQLAGYILTGLTSEQCMFIPHGEGENGKTVEWETIKSVMGDYAKTTPPETLMMRKNTGGASPDIARLQGSRLALASEPGETAFLAEPVIKRITGQDTIVCRHLYGNLFEFTPQFKVVLLTNYKPIIRGDDHAIWRRICLIPYPVTISPEERNKNLISDLRDEYPGILNWMLKGAISYQQGGLQRPKCVEAAINEYRSSMDIIADWIVDCCVEDSRAETDQSDLYGSYKRWAQENGLRPMSNKSFGPKLERRGFEKRHNRRGNHRCGIGLRPSHAEDLIDRPVNGAN